MTPIDRMTSLDVLRAALAFASNSGESVAMQYSPIALVRLWEAYRASATDLPLRQWTAKQCAPGVPFAPIHSVTVDVVRAAGLR